MLIAAAEREVEAEEQNGGEAAVEGGPSGGGVWREDESPDEPLPEVPTPSPEIPDPVPTGEKKHAPHRPAPLPPNGAAESAQFAQFRQMLADATAGASVEGNACATLWSKGVSVIKSLEGTDGFDKEHFTLFLYKELYVGSPAPSAGIALCGCSLSLFSWISSGLADEIPLCSRDGESRVCAFPPPIRLTTPLPQIGVCVCVLRLQPVESC